MADFYNRILGFYRAPIVTGRIIDLKKEASNVQPKLKDTFFKKGLLIVGFNSPLYSDMTNFPLAYGAQLLREGSYPKNLIMLYKYLHVTRPQKQSVCKEVNNVINNSLLRQQYLFLWCVLLL